MASSTAVASTISSQPITGDRKPLAPPQKQNFMIRRMGLRDIYAIGEQNRRAYWKSPVNNFLSPRAPEHPEQLARIFRQQIRNRYCNPNSLSIVACTKENPSVPLGYSQSVRQGNDNWAKSKGTLVLAYLYILSWIFWAYDKLDLWLVPDVITNVENVKTFGSWNAEDKAKYWTPYPERDDRWWAATLVVAPEWQGQGIGRLLMGEVLERSQRERVVCGLTASTHGEFLYRKLGFEYLGDFSHRLPEEGEETGGGVMCWFPEGWEGRRNE